MKLRTIDPKRTEVDMEKEGWGKCQNTPKWHYFVENRSLCRRFGNWGEQELQRGNDNSSDNCKACITKLAKRGKNEATHD